MTVLPEPSPLERLGCLAVLLILWTVALAVIVAAAFLLGWM